MAASPLHQCITFPENPPLPPPTGPPPRLATDYLHRYLQPVRPEPNTAPTADHHRGSPAYLDRTLTTIPLMLFLPLPVHFVDFVIVIMLNAIHTTVNNIDHA